MSIFRMCGTWAHLGSQLERQMGRQRSGEYPKERRGREPKDSQT